MIGILIIAHDSLAEGLARAVTHVLGSRPPQFEVLSVAATDDPTALLPAARELVRQLDMGSRVAVFSVIYAASPVNLPVLVRAFTYRARDMETLLKRAVSGGCDGVLHMNVDPVYAATRS